MINACVIGWPISHSRSPMIHSHWLREHSIAGSYRRVPVEPDQLPGFISSIRRGEYVGCNVTIPHKEAVIRLVDELDERVRRIGSANTLYFRNGRLLATSTDGEGFCMNVKSNLKHFDFAGARVLILGAGGSALAVTDEILRQGAAKVTVANRSIARAQAFEAQFGSKVTAAALQDVANAAGACDLLVNTTPLGMQGHAPLTFDFSTLHPKAAVADIVYTPLITDFLRVASTRGFPIVTGLGMLLHQAVKGFELWFGVRPNVTKELHDLIARDIDADYQK